MASETKPMTDCPVSMSFRTLSGRLEEIAKAVCESHTGEAAYLIGRLQADVDHHGMHDFMLATLNDPKAVACSTTPVHRGPVEVPPPGMKVGRDSQSQAAVPSEDERHYPTRMNVYKPML